MEGKNDNVEYVVSANNKFALDLYSQLKNKDGNVFFSPLSISTALAMTYEGAKGKTADEMQSVLYLPKDNNICRLGFAELHEELNRKDSKHKLSMANALWIQKSYVLLQEYVDVVKKYYSGEANNVDFVNATKKARNKINRWVEGKTNDKIKDLIPQGVLDSITRLVLTNAIYFKGTWVKQFDKKKTADEDFRVSKGQTVKVPMMKQEGNAATFNYAETKDLQVLEMPYDGNKLSMLVLLPKNDDMNSLEKSFTLENLVQLQNQLYNQRVDVYIPKFKFDSKYGLKENLMRMGMPTAFTGASDFSGMDGTKNLFIGDVIHQAFVDVNEEGTEAAAATVVVMNLRCAISPQKVPVFRADHPFMFLIQEKENRNILFLGRVNNPKR